MKNTDAEGKKPAPLTFSPKLFEGSHAADIGLPPTAMSSRASRTADVQHDVVVEIQEEIKFLDSSIDLMAARKLILEGLLQDIQHDKKGKKKVEAAPREEDAPEDADEEDPSSSSSATV